MRILALCGNSNLSSLFEMRKKSEFPPVPSLEYAWFHCASLGEYEQASPVIESYVSLNPKTPILITFFSPSGYNPVMENPPSWIRKGDSICALPFDTPGRIRAFLKSVDYRIKFFATCKYEVWPELMKQLQGASIHTCIFGAHIYKGSALLRKSIFGAFLRNSWSQFSTILTQDSSSVEELEQFKISSEAIGDPRVDRVLQLAINAKPSADLLKWKSSSELVVAGSTWRPEEISLTTLPWSESRKLLIAPHEIEKSHIDEILSLFNSTSRIASLLSEGRLDTPVIIADSMGELTSYYHLADLAVVGGGFGKGIHNILEPAAHGIRIITGPKIRRFREAVKLKEEGVLNTVSESNLLASVVWSALSAEKPSSTWLDSQKGCVIKIVSTLP